MSKNFWKKLNKLAFAQKSFGEARPFFALAPMADITDAAFRLLVARKGKPDIVFTEMVSADGLCSEDGRPAMMPSLIYDKTERPIIAQLFGNNPEKFRQAAEIVRDLGFDGIDINMGCPQEKIVKQGAGAALIREPELAKKIILETKKGTGDLPVSVKTRLGWDKNIIGEWMRRLLEVEPAAITIHGRTKKQMFGGEADWSAIAEAVKTIRTYEVPILRSPVIIGNGDIKNIEEGIEKAKMSGVDGVMIGRAALGNPWVFRDFEILPLKTLSERDWRERGEFSVENIAEGLRRQMFQNPATREKVKTIIEHTELFGKIFGPNKNFHIMKKHFAAYCRGFDGAKELRIKLMEANSSEEAKNIIKTFSQKN